MLGIVGVQRVVNGVPQPMDAGCCPEVLPCAGATAAVDAFLEQGVAAAFHFSFYPLSFWRPPPPPWVKSYLCWWFASGVYTPGGPPDYNPPRDPRNSDPTHGMDWVITLAASPPPQAVWSGAYVRSISGQPLCGTLNADMVVTWQLEPVCDHVAPYWQLTGMIEGSGGSLCGGGSAAAGDPETVQYSAPLTGWDGKRPLTLSYSGWAGGIPSGGQTPDVWDRIGDCGFPLFVTIYPV